MHMSTELKQAAQDAVEAIDWLLKNIRRDAPQLSGKAMGNAEKCACALRIAILQAQQAATPEPIGRAFYAADDDTGAGYHMKPYAHWFGKASAADSKLYTAPKPAQATQPAEVTDGFVLVNRGTIESAMQHVPYRGEVWQELNAAILALRPERVPMSMGKAVMYGTHLYAGIMEGEVREVKNSVLIEFPSRQDWGAFLRWHDGITAQAKKVGA